MSWIASQFLPDLSQGSDKFFGPSLLQSLTLQAASSIGHHSGPVNFVALAVPIRSRHL
jgi:hypothetical protein